MSSGNNWVTTSADSNTGRRRRIQLRWGTDRWRRSTRSFGVLVVAFVVTMSAFVPFLFVGVGPVAAVGGGSVTTCGIIATSGTYTLQNDLSNTSGTSCLSIVASDVVLDGSGYQVNDTGASSIHVASGTSNVTVRDITAIGGPVGVEFGGDDGFIQNVSAHTSTTGVHLGGSDNTVTSVNASDVGGNGFTITGSNNTVSWSKANRAGASGFGVAGDGNLVVSSTVNDAHNWGIHVTESDDNTFDNITVDDAGQSGVYFRDANNTIAKDIRARGSGDYSVNLLRAPDSEIDDSVVGDSPWGIYVSDSPGTTVSDTVVNNTTFEHGISVGSSPGTTVSNNTVTNTTDHGIILASSNDSVVADNEVETVGIHGIYVGGENQSVEGNLVSGTVGSLDASIYLKSLTNSTVSENRVVDSSAYSIKLDGSDNNTLNGNSISGSNYFGFEVYNSDGNLFYDNFLNSSSNARVASSSGNVWNVTKQSGTNVVKGPFLGGNYWAKPDGSGYSQTCTDADEDGICDAAYGPTSYDVMDALPLAPVPDIGVLPRTHDFGDVEVGTNTNLNVSVDNDGLAPLSVTDTVISGANASEFNVTSGGGSATIAPGEQRNVTVEFGPNTEEPKSATLTVSSNDTDEPGIAVSLSGSGVITNHKPTVLDDEFVVYEGQNLTVGSPGLFVNDYDADGDSFSVVAIGSSPSNGSLSNVNGGGFEYAPDEGFSGADSFTYSVADSNGGQSSFATVTIEVRPDSNSAPRAVPDNYSVVEGQTLTVSAPGRLANDYDAYGNPFTTVAIGTSPSNGSIVGYTDGSFEYTPDPGFTGTDSFTYSNADERGDQSPFVPVTITVHPNPNRDPVAVEDWLTTAKDTNLTVTDSVLLPNDYDPDGDTMNVVAVGTSPSNGTLIPTPDGDLKYIPDTGFTGADSFTYSISDENGGQSSFETVHIRVIDDTGDTPTAVEDRYSTVENQTLSVSAPGGLANDYDPNGDSFTSVAVGTSPSNGSIVPYTDGSFEYTPDPGFTGTDSFTYSIEDTGGSQSPFVTVTIEVTPNPNRAPEITPDRYVAVENQTLTVSAPGHLANDFDPDGDSFTSVAVGSSPPNGSIVPYTDGSFEYTPDPGFTGMDSFTYSIADGSGAQSAFETVTIEVLPDPNKFPAAANDSFAVDENETLTVSNPGVLQNDYDANGDSLTISALTSPSNGSLSLQNDGGFTYTPDPGFTGNDSFMYAAEEPGGNQSEWVTVTIDVVANSTSSSEPDDSSETQEDESNDEGNTDNSDDSSTDDSTNDGGNDNDDSTGGSDSSDDDTGSSTPQLPGEDDPVVNTTGTAQTDVRSDNESLEVNVTDISDGDTVDVRLPDQKVSDDFDEHGGALEGIETRFEGDGEFDMNVSYSPSPPGGDEEPPGGGLGYVTVDHNANDEIVDEVAFTFRVSSSLLEARGVEPSDAVLYRYHDGEWTALETEIVGMDNGTYRFRSISPGLSVFAIGVRGDDAPSESETTTADETTDYSTDDTTTDSTDSPAEETTTPSDETTEADRTQTTESSTPGFGIVVAVVALLAVALLGRRRE